jgi:hypothetical protein
MKFEVKRIVQVSEAGYLHIPLLSMSFGRNGFMLCVLGVSFTLIWKNQ